MMRGNFCQALSMCWDTWYLNCNFLLIWHVYLMWRHIVVLFLMLIGIWWLYWMLRVWYYRFILLNSCLSEFCGRVDELTENPEKHAYFSSYCVKLSLLLFEQFFFIYYYYDVIVVVGRGKVSIAPCQACHCLPSRLYFLLIEYMGSILLILHFCSSCEDLMLVLAAPRGDC